jgi:hypothetical protein
MSKSTIISSYNIVFCEEMFHSNKVLHNVLIYVLSGYLYLIREGGVGLELYRALGNPGSIHTYIAIPSRLFSA